MTEENKTRKMSAAAFFNENKAIAGFGNSMRAVFTSVRELVENGLDAAEKLGVNPEIYIELRKLSSSEINELLDITRYKQLEKHLDFLQLTCRDNGVGVPGHEIPNLFGRVLTGTKYGVIQTRGRFGLGAKMCLLHSMSSVDLPAKIKSRYFMEELTSEVHLMINLEKNEPVVMEQHEYYPDDPEYLQTSGTEISITFTGAWNLAKNSIKEYFKQLAIITPYASFTVVLPGDEEGTTETLVFQKVVDDMPTPPKVIKLHPFGCDITQFKAKIAVTSAENLIDFLSNDFMGVRKEVAEEFFQILEIDPQKKPSELTSKEIRRIVHEGFIKAYQEAKEIKRKRDRVFRFDAPQGDALSPLGAARLKKGLEKELEPEFVEAISRPPKAYSGHPFIVEAAIGYGGGVSKQAQQKGSTSIDNKIIYRYANRIPLIFGAGNDVITKVVSSLNWSEYGLTRQADPLAVAVSIVSTKIPFPETSKEYISTVPEIEEEIRLALQQLGRRLKTFLSRAKRRKREHARLSRFVRSAPVVVDNLAKILENEKIVYTNINKEKYKIAAALAHGSKKKIRNFVPLGTPLFELNVWCPDKYKKKCHDNNITTIGKFLSINNSELAKILGLSVKQVSRIKQRTIYELDKSELSPSLPTRLLSSKIIEKRFSKKEGNASFNEALFQRWIQNSFHFLATEPPQLRLVEGLVERLIENKKYSLISNLESSQETENSLELANYIQEFKFELDGLNSHSELKEEFLYPNFTYLKANYPNFSSKFRGLEDFIFKMNEPSSFKYEKELTEFLITYVKKVFFHIAEKFPEFLNENATKMQPDWIDGYTKNAFHRRNIATIKDFLDKPLKDLLEIKELERSIYTRFFSILAKTEKSVPLSKIELLSNLDEEQKVKLLNLLKSSNIETLAQFVNVKARIFLKKDYDFFVNHLLGETKRRVIAFLGEKNSDLDLSHLKIIDPSTEENLLANKIFTSTSFLITPSPKLRAMGMLKSELARVKKTIGTPIPDFLSLSKHANKHEIYTVEDILYSKPEDFGIEDEQIKKLYTKDYLFLRTPLIFAFPEFNEKINVLNDVGVNCIGRFLIWNNEDLASILNVNKNEVQRFKQNISIEKIEQNKEKFKNNLNIIQNYFPLLIRKLHSYNLTLQELFYLYIEENLFPASDFFKTLTSIQEFLDEDVLFLAKVAGTKSKSKTLNDALLKLKTKDINTIRDFLQISPVFIETEISKNKDRKALLELYNSIQSKNLSVSNDFSEKLLLSYELIDFYQFMQLPITRIKNLGLKEYELLASKKVFSLHQFFNYSFDELKEILQLSHKNFKEVIDNLQISRDGQEFYKQITTGKYETNISFDFESSERFSPDEILSLLISGYDSIDKLFYLTHPYTFSATIIKWGVIEKFKKILRSPLTLVTWERKIKKQTINEETQQKEEIEEIKISSFTHDQLNSLRRAGIRRIIDFFLVEDETIASILKIDLIEAKKLKTDIRISEAGTDLSELDIFKPSIIQMLEENNVFTIEDLYFSTQEEKWTIPDIPWVLIQNLKDVLNLKLQYLTDMLDPSIINLLKKNKINTLLGFLLTSSKVLMERTGIPDERFDNIKRSLDLGEIYYFFSLPVYFLPNLSFYQTETLRKEGITTIVDFVKVSTTKINKIINLSTSEIKEIRDLLTSQRIREEYELRAIYAYETKLFDKNEQRNLSKETIYSYEGFQSIQELFYCPNDVFMDKTSSTWRKVFTLKKILSLPLQIFQEISDYSLIVFNQNNITHLYHLIFILDNDLTDRTLFRTVSDYSSKLIDLRAYHYFDFIPANAYNKEFFQSILGEIEDFTLLDVVSDTNLVSSLADSNRQIIFEKCNITLLRSVFELPLSITPLLDQLQDEARETFSNFTLGHIFETEIEENSPLLQIRNKLSEENSLDNLISALSVPISSLNLNPTLTLPLSHSSITTLIDFYSTPTKRLAELSGETQKQINEIKDALSYNSIIQLHKERAHPITPSSLITELEIERLKEIGIHDIETLYYAGTRLGALSILSQEKYEEFKEIMSGSISFLSFLSFEEIKKLELYDIHSVIDLSLFGKEQLSSILNNPIYHEFHIFELLSLDEIKEKRLRFTIPLDTCPSITPEYIEKLHELGIYSVQDFISRMDEIRKSYPYLVNMNVFKEATLYLSSVLFLDLQIEQMLKLVYSGVGDILTFLTEDVTTISLILGISEEAIIKIKENITIKSIQAKIELEGVKLEDFSVLPKRNLSYLQKLDKYTVQDLYSFSYQIKTFSEEFNEHINTFLSLCNSSIFRLSPLAMEVKRKLAQSRILRVIDLFIVDSKKLKRLLNSSTEELTKIKKGEFSLNSGILVPETNSTLVDILTACKFIPSKITLIDIYGLVPEYLLIFSESERIEKANGIALLEQFIYSLSLNIFAISDFSITTKQDLWVFGIKNVVELLSLTTKERNLIPIAARREINQFLKDFSAIKLPQIIPKNLLDILEKKTEEIKIETHNELLYLLDLLAHPFITNLDKLFSYSATFTAKANYPITWLNKFGLKENLAILRQFLANNKYTILDILLSSNETISAINDDIIETINDLTIPQWAIKLDDVTFLSKNQLSILKKQNLEYLDQLLYLNKASLLNEELEKITCDFSLFKTTPVSFLLSLSPEKLSILFESKITTILDFLLFPTSLLSSILGLELNKIVQTKKSIDKKQLVSNLKLFGIDLHLLPALSMKDLKEFQLPPMKSVQKPIDLKKQYEKPEVSTIEYLNKRGIYSLIQVSYSNLSDFEIADTEREKIVASIPLLYTPLITLEREFGISFDEINSLTSTKTTYYNLLHLPISLWHESLEELINKIKENEELFVKKLTSLQFSSLDLANLKLNKSLIGKLYNLGVFSIEYLYFLPEEFFNDFPESYLNEIKDVQRKLGRNVNNLPNLSEDTIKYCYENKIVTIIDAIFSIQKLKGRMVDEILADLSSLKQLTFEAFSEPLTPFEEKAIKQGYLSYQDLLGDINLKENKELLCEFSPYLLANIRFLDIEEKELQSLKNNKIFTIADVLFTPYKTIASKTRIKLSRILELRSSIKLEELQEKIEANKENHFSDLPFLSENEKTLLSSNGFYCFSDLEENTIYSWIHDVKKINKIRSTIEEILNSSILFIDTISTTDFQEIESKYFSNNLYSIKDLILAGELEKIGSYETVISALTNQKKERLKTCLSVKEFLGAVDPKTLFSNNLEQISIDNTIDLITSLIKNKQSLTNVGLEILNYLKSPLSIITEFSKSELTKLQTHNTNIILDLLIKPSSHFTSLTQKQKEKLNTIISTLNINFIRELRDKRIQLSNVALFDSETKKELLKHYIIIDDLMYDLSKDDCKLNAKTRKRVLNIMNKSIYLISFPQIQLNSWLKLVLNVKTVKDLFLISKNELSSLLNISIDNVDSFLSKITSSRIINPPTLKKNIFLFDFDIGALREKGIKNFIDLFATNNFLNDLSSPLKIKVNLMKKLSIRLFDKKLPDINLEQLIFLNSHIDSIKVDANLHKYLSDIYSLLFSRPTTLEDILSMKIKEEQLTGLTFEALILLKQLDKSQYKKILDSFSEDVRNRLAEFFLMSKRNIVLLYGPGYENIHVSVKYGFLTIEELFVKPNYMLLELIDDEKLIRQLKKLNLVSLRSLSSQLTEIPANILDKEEKDELHKQQILSIEEALVFNLTSKSKTSKRWKITEKIRTRVEQNLFALPFILESREVFNSLLTNNIKSIYDLLLSKQSSKSDIEDLLSRVQFNNIEELLDQSRTTLHNFIKDEDVIEELNKNKIFSLGELLFLFESENTAEFSSKIKELLSCLRASVSLFIKQKNILSQLAKRGYEQISDLIFLKDFSSLSIKLTEKQTEEFNFLLKTLDFLKIKEYLDTYSYRIKELGLFSDSEKIALENAGYTHVIHFSISKERISLQTSLSSSQISQLKDLLSYPIYTFSALIQDNPKSVLNLYKKKIYSFWEFFEMKFDEIVKLTNIKERQLKNYLATLTPQSLKIAKRDKTQIVKSTPFVNTDNISKLKEIGVSSFEELIFIEQKNIRKDAYKSDNVQKLLGLLEEKIERLNIEQSIKTKLKSLGIEKIVEFMIYPTSQLEGKLDMTYNEIKKIKQTIPILPISEKKEVKTRTTTKKPSTTTKKPSTTTKKPSTTTKKPSTKQATLDDIPLNDESETKTKKSK